MKDLPNVFRVGLEPATLGSKGIDSTNAPPRPAVDSSLKLLNFKLNIL